MTLEVFICICVIILAYIMQFSFEEKETKLTRIVSGIANIIIVVTLGYLLGLGVYELWLWELRP